MDRPIRPEVQIARIFGSEAARRGAVVRRKVRDVERCAGRDLFLSEMRRRGFVTVENTGQFVVFCNREPLRRVTKKPVSARRNDGWKTRAFSGSFDRRQCEGATLMPWWRRQERRLR